MRTETQWTATGNSWEEMKRNPSPCALAGAGGGPRREARGSPPNRDP